MKKNEQNEDEVIFVKFNRKQIDEFKDYLDSKGIDLFIKYPEIEEIEPENEKDLVRARVPKGKEFFDVFYGNMDFDSWVPPVGLGMTFFLNTTIPDAFLIDYIGSRVSLRVNDYFKLTSFFHDALGFPKEFPLSKDSNLVRLLAMYSRYKTP